MRFKERGGEFKKNGLKIWVKTKPKRIFLQYIRYM